MIAPLERGTIGAVSFFRFWRENPVRRPHLESRADATGKCPVGRIGIRCRLGTGRRETVMGVRVSHRALRLYQGEGGLAAYFPLVFFVSSWRGLFQYGFLHFGQTLGFPSVFSRGTHSCPQRSHR